MVNTEEQMALTVKIPELSTSDDSFVVNVHNPGALVRDAKVTLTVTAKAAGSKPVARKFSVDGAKPPTEEGKVDLEGHQHTLFEVSDWGKTEEGDTIAVTVAGSVSNDTVVIASVDA